MLRLLSNYLPLQLAWLLALSLGACGPSVEQGQDVRIQTFPRDTISFGRVAIGGTLTENLVITNLGADTLTINSITWEGDPSIYLTFPSPPEGHKLTNNARYTLQVNFQPSAQAPAPRGDIVIRSNDPIQETLRLPVTTQQVAPRLQVSPGNAEALRFGHVEIGNSTTRDVTISNVGDIPLLLTDVFLNGSAEFSLQTSAAPLPATLVTGSNPYEVAITYSPTGIGQDFAELIILSNDPAIPTYVLPLEAGSSTPCIAFEPPTISFSPAVSVGLVHTRNLRVRSCGSVPLLLYGVTQGQGDDTQIFLRNMDSLQNREVPPGQTLELEILFAPAAEGVQAATFNFFSNDPLRPQADLQILAEATTNQCPTAVARARVAGSGFLSQQVAALPLDLLILDGTASYDPETTITTWNWEVTQRPDGSTAILQNRGDGLAELFLDLAGDYEICLTVVDAQNTQSCNVDCVAARARPSDKIHVQLIWQTPADPVIGDDDGTDLDLHFTRIPQGAWGDKGDDGARNGWDVFFLNRTPLWRIAGLATESPRLDRDDTDGEGPENVNHDDPNPCSWYAVGAHYFNDNGFGTSYATLRVYINGQKRYEKLNLRYDLTGTFRYIALMHWDGNTARVFDIDEVFSAETWIGTKPHIPDHAAAAIELAAPQCFQ